MRLWGEVGAVVGERPLPAWWVAARRQAARAGASTPDPRGPPAPTPPNPTPLTLSYRAVLRATAIFTWPDAAGAPWRDALRASARSEFEAARGLRDPEAVARALVLGRAALTEAIDKVRDGGRAVGWWLKRARGDGGSPPRSRIAPRATHPLHLLLASPHPPTPSWLLQLAAKAGQPMPPSPGAPGAPPPT